MTTPARTCLVALFSLALGSLGPSVAAAADEPVKEATKELRVPAAPSQELRDQLAALLGAMNPELHPSLFAAVADAEQRLRASQLAAAEGKGELLDVRAACRAALRDADFAGISKRKAKVVEAVVELAVLQLTVNLHAALRDSVGRQLAIRSVRACAGKTACLDAIVPTAEMPARHITSVRTSFEGKMKELEAADRLGNFEIQQLGVVYNRTSKSQSNVSAKYDEFVRSIADNFRA